MNTILFLLCTRNSAALSILTNSRTKTQREPIRIYFTKMRNKSSLRLNLRQETRQIIKMVSLHSIVLDSFQPFLTHS